MAESRDDNQGRTGALLQIRRGVTVRDYARFEQVSEVTVRRWIVKGAVPVRRTPGGGVRVIIPDQT
jgi:transposase-like protein